MRMTERVASLADRVAGAFWRAPWMYGWLLNCAVLVPLLSFRRQSELVGCYLPAARRVLDGQPLPGPEMWVYPPAFIVPVLPLASLPLWLARMLWSLMLISAAVYSARCLWSALMLDDRFRVAVRKPPIFCAFLALFAASSAGHLAVPLGYQSHDVLVLLFVVLGTLWSAQAVARGGSKARYGRRAGVAYGVAASCKVMPGLFLPVLLAQRRWLAAAAMLGTGVVVAVGFDLVSLWVTGRPHFIDWLRLAAQGSDLTASGGGRWDVWNALNQSGTGILTRLMVPTPADKGLDHECMLLQVDDGVRRLVLGSWIALVVGTLTGFAWWSASTLRVSSLGSKGSESPALWALGTAGATSATYLLIAPHASNYHFAPIGIGAASMLAWILTRDRDPVLIGCLGGMILLELIPGRDLLGARLADIKLAYGSIGLTALLSAIGSLRLMRRASNAVLG